MNIISGKNFSIYVIFILEKMNSDKIVTFIIKHYTLKNVLI